MKVESIVPIEPERLKFRIRQSYMRDHVIVKYTDERLSEQASVAFHVVDRALDAFRDRLHWVAGWNEYGQAIKFAVHEDVDRSADTAFASGIVHEITHHVIGDLLNDHAAYWLQEGLAEYYERHLLPGLRVKENGQMGELEERPWTFDQLERMNLEALPATDARLYYQYSYDLMQFFMKQYDEDDLVK